MGQYVILSRFVPGSLVEPADLRQRAATVKEKIHSECPGVSWSHSYATMGSYDVVDVVEADDPVDVEKAAMIIRGYGHATTETLTATPWDAFLEAL